MKKLASSAAVAALFAATPAAIYAQETSSELRGTVTDASGAPVSGATVTIIHAPSGTAATATSGGNGAFFQGGLRPGGPYTILVQAPGLSGEAMDNVFLQPGPQAPMRISLGGATVDTITVFGQAVNTLDLNSGVGSNYSARDIANQPGAARDVISTLLRDPLASSNGVGNLSVAGVNPRFNGLSIDGALQQDNFGLGANTYATNRSPINIDLIEAASIVASDYSVTASSFTGGLVNIVTRGGTNEFDGAAFYYYADQDFLGSSTFGGSGSFNSPPFEEKEYGLSVRGPIIRDRLFFSVSYDEYESARAVDFTATDTAFGIQPGFFDALTNMVQSTYGINIMGRPQQLAVPETSKRLFLRIDWNINDNHRAQFSYQDTSETGTSNVGATNLVSAWYDVPTDVTSYTAQLFSDWSPNFSTTLRASLVEFVRGQNCRQGNDIGEMQFVLNPANIAGTPLAGLYTGTNRTFIAGCDRFRHANEYNDTRFQVFASGDYIVGDHIITFGGEFERFDVFNLFVDTSQGSFIFTGPTAGSDITNRIANVNYRNVPSNVTSDGAAEWSFDRWVLFAQDRWQITPVFELSAGLRYERISQDDRPAADAAFQADYGRPSNNNLDGLDLFLPRVGFRWDAADRTTVTGGFGLFSGGSPAVWVSNAFQAPTVFASASNVMNVDPTIVPAGLIASVAAGTPRVIDTIAPDFEMPSDWKASLRVDHEFDANIFGFNLGSGYLFSAQYLYTQTNNGFLWTNLAQTELAATQPTGVAPDGRPIYADLQALGLLNDTELSNYSGDTSHVFTVSLANEFDNGFGFAVSYAHQDVQATTEGTSSRGVSSWRGIVDIDRNNPSSRTSPFEVKHQFRASFSYERDFIPNLPTRIDVFGQIRSGTPFTYTYDIDNNNALFGRAGAGENPFDNNPLYIPTPGGDSRVVYNSTFDQAGFFNYVDARGISTGQVHDVNSARSAWNQRWDLRLQQTLPGIPGAERFFGDNNFRLVLDIENFLNLLNDSWGAQYNGPGNNQLPIVRADLIDRVALGANPTQADIDAAAALTGDAPRTTCQAAGDCVYRYNSFSSNNNPSFRSHSQSVWRARIGIRYEF